MKECHPDRHINSPKSVQLHAVERFKVGFQICAAFSMVIIVFCALLSSHACMQRVKEAYETLSTGAL